MNSIVDALPPELARLVHPDVRSNESDYWAGRDQLLARYRDQWIAFSAGQVIASSASPVEVFHQAQASARHPFVTCVGREDEPFRVRRVSFAYDASYPREPLPVVSVEIRCSAGAPGTMLDRVIPDTGADASVMPWSDCQQIGLATMPATPVYMSGVGASVVPTVMLAAWVHLDGTDYPCSVQVDYGGQERILGRDVLNRMDVLFRGPAREVVLNP